MLQIDRRLIVIPLFLLFSTVAIWILKNGKSPILSSYPHIPVYPNSESVSPYKREGGPNIYEARWKTEDSAADVIKWYGAEFNKSRSWVVVRASNEEGLDSQVLELTNKKWKYFLVAEREDEETETTIKVIVSPKEEL